MTDLVERIRKWRDERGFPTPGELLDEAAAEITRLTAEVERHRMTPQERRAADAAATAALSAAAGEVWKPLSGYLLRTAPEAK